MGDGAPPIGLPARDAKFSKFVHGTAFLHHRTGRVKELPYWWAQEYLPLWAGSSLKKGKLPIMILKQAVVKKLDDDDFREERSGWSNHSTNSNTWEREVSDSASIGSGSPQPGPAQRMGWRGRDPWSSGCRV